MASQFVIDRLFEKLKYCTTIELADELGIRLEQLEEILRKGTRRKLTAQKYRFIRDYLSGSSG